MCVFVNSLDANCFLFSECVIVLHKLITLPTWLFYTGFPFNGS